VGTYEIDDDPARIDPAAAVAFLTTAAYWGRWRTDPDIRRQIAEAWRVVGAYDQAGAMVGFARAISDGGTAYLADVYVLPEHRGLGLGQAIVAMMVEAGPGAGGGWVLHPAGAHSPYPRGGVAAPPPPHPQKPPDAGGGGGAPPRGGGGGWGGDRPPRGSTNPYRGPRAAGAARPAPRAGAAEGGGPGSVAVPVGPGAPGRARHAPPRRGRPGAAGP